MEFIQTQQIEMKISRVAFMNRLGAKLRNVYELAAANIDVMIFKDKMMVATYIDLSDPDTMEGLNSLVGVIYTQEEVDEILQTPPREKELP